MYCEREITPREFCEFDVIGLGRCECCIHCRPLRFDYCARCDSFLIKNDTIIDDPTECPGHEWGPMKVLFVSCLLLTVSF